MVAHCIQRYLLPMQRGTYGLVVHDICFTRRGSRVRSSLRLLVLQGTTPWHCCDVLISWRSLQATVIARHRFGFAPRLVNMIDLLCAPWTHLCCKQTSSVDLGVLTRDDTGTCVAQPVWSRPGAGLAQPVFGHLVVHRHPVLHLWRHFDAFSAQPHVRHLLLDTPAETELQARKSTGTPAR